MTSFYDFYYENSETAKQQRTQPKRVCNNLTHIYFNRDTNTIYNKPQYEPRHELKKQNMFGLIGNQKAYEEPLQRETTRYESVQIIDTRNPLSKQFTM